MHRLPSKSVIWRYRLASILVVITFLLFSVFLGYMAYGVWQRDLEWIIVSGWIFAVGLLVLLLNLIISSRLNCPLCLVQPLLNRGCSKHRNVKRIFGSHKLKVASSILISGHFACPYCGEKTVMKTRAQNP